MDVSKTSEYVTLGLGILFAIEQVLAGVPSIKANSTFQLVCNLTEAFVGIFKKKEGA